MRILLLVTSFNSQTQAVYTKLKDLKHEVSVCFYTDEEQTLNEIEYFEPELILCPFLENYLGAKIYDKYPVFIFHPGPRGDRGPHSLEHALKSHTKKWGLVILRANKLYDGGNIYAQEDFNVRDTYKSSIYRQEIVSASLNALDTFFENIKSDNFVEQIPNPIHKKLSHEDETINWSTDVTQEIIEKIHLCDSVPGILDEILGLPCYLYGAHKESKLKGKPKEILAKRDGAICLGTVDGALWITHLKQLDGFKLPSTYVLKERLQGIKEERLPLIFDKSYDTFYELSVEKKQNVAYVYFDFHNGAMNTAQCIRLKYAIEYLKTECEVLVLMGGEDFFSNGIHLNILEDSQKQGEDGWANINAMNDVINAIIYADEVVTIASFSTNAGAGGVFMGLACDYVVAKEGVVLNPHYKTLGLSGSEYHTYTLPKRVGDNIAKKLLEECLPISVSKAKKLGIIDEVFSHTQYLESLHCFALSKYDDEFLWDKEEFLEENKAKIEDLKEKELKVMYSEFWDNESKFHKLRHEFVYKISLNHTPLRLKLKC
ncbi:hydrogenase [Poseidonibacter lekithochrous]|uniref:enoyl-CoA hydratase-related protein n=1 Tax=Poseidonibacter TaxID=2321187 RepID=UPI001C080179|nr:MULTISPECIES: enoyl-CoA hydratase-related protein [Poseidonibacter]MBU3013925.1 hydrogenase [Poseidonibacter lekithochrous]MDO6827220.1 enoyl-CoA hydratase-related protein [Poseidonibacter sp. 1_MG-2023]